MKKKISEVVTTDKNNKIDKNRWVINISDKDISGDKHKVLMHGLNFAVTPKSLPIKEIVTSTELACIHINNPKKSQSLRADVVKILKKFQIVFSKKNKRCCIEGRDIST